MKKFKVIGSAIAAVILSAAMVTTAFAESNPADDAADYSFNAGRSAYEERMAEDHAWYDNEDESVTADYSINAGSRTAQSRSGIFAGMPTGDDVTKEAVEAWFAANGIGEGSAWADGQYDESAKANYGYAKGQAAYAQRHAAFSGNA